MKDGFILWLLGPTSICKTTMNWWQNPNVYELRVQTAESQQEQESTPNASWQNK